MRRWFIIFALASVAVAQTPQTGGMLGLDQVWTRTNQFTLGITVGPITFSALSGISNATSIIYVSDATLGSNPCSGGGTGALAIRINGAWNCSAGFSGGGGCTISSSNPNGIVYLNGSSVCTTAADFTFKDADNQHGNAPHLAIGTAFDYTDNTNFAPGTGVPALTLGTSSFSGLVNLVGPGGSVALSTGAPYSNSTGNLPPALVVAGNALLGGGGTTLLDPCGITAIARSANVVTVTHDGSCAFLNVDASTLHTAVVISGVTDASYNGNFTVATITPATNKFTYAQVAGNSSSSGGRVQLATGGNTLASTGNGNLSKLGWTFYASSSTDLFSNPYGMRFIVGNAMSGGQLGGPIVFKAGDGNVGFGTGAGGDIAFTPGAGLGGAANGTFKVVNSPIQSVPATFSALPTCAAGTEGSMRAITDSSTNTWGATIAGGGANHVLAYCDGTNWTVAAK